MNRNIHPDVFALTAIFDGMQDAVLTHDLEHRISNCNPAVKVVLGYDLHDLRGKSIFQLIPESLHAEQQALFRTILRGEPVAPFRTVRLNALGQSLPVSLVISPVKNRNGDIIGASQIIRDITQEIRAEVAINRLAAIIEDSEDAIVSKTLNGIITTWNRAAEQMFGFSAEDAIGKSITLIIPEDRLAEEDLILSRIRAGERIENFETIRKSKNGDRLPISLTVSPIRDYTGNVVGVSKIARNIAVRKVADERQARLAAIVDSSDDAIIGKTLEGIVISWNQGAEKIFGYSEQEAIGKHISFIIPTDRLEEENSILTSIRSGKKIDHFRTVRKRKDGSLVTVSLTISPIKDSKGNVIGASKVARDITQEQIGNEALRQYAERLQMLNSLAKAISEKLDVQDILQKVTDSCTQLVGAAFGAFFYNVVDQEGESYMLYTLSGAPKAAFDRFGMPRNTPIFHATFSGEGILRVDDIKRDPRYGHIPPHFGMPEGHLAVTSFLSVPVFSGGGKVIGGLFFGHPEVGKFTSEHEDLVVNMAAQAGVALDNSALFEQVRDLSRKKDEFIALAAHELKTPLTSMSGFLQLVKTRVEDPVNSSFLDKCLNQLGKLTALINNLFDVSKIQAGKMQLQYESFDLVELAGEIIEPQREGNIHALLLLAEGPVYVEADRLRLEQVITNFIDNAVKYSAEGATVTIRIEDTGNQVLFSVQDEGIGIRPENLEHIFSQFYRAEGLSKKISGMGLGLYISKEIIQRHSGSVKVDSELGKGSTFTFVLPKQKIH